MCTDTIRFPDDLEHSFTHGLLNTTSGMDDTSTLADATTFATNHKAEASSFTDPESSLPCVPDQDQPSIHNYQSGTLLAEDVEFYDDNQDDGGKSVKGQGKQQQTLHGMTPISPHPPLDEVDQRKLSNSVCGTARSSSHLNSLSLDSIPVVFLPRTKKRKAPRKANRRRM